MLLFRNDNVQDTSMAWHRRQEAAAFIESLTGTAVDHTTDQAFRAGLRDGVLLCNVVNFLVPGRITEV